MTSIEEAFANVQAAVGRKHELDSANFNPSEATRDSFRQFANGMLDYNPLWRNEAYAAKSRFGGLTAPPTWIGQVAAPFGPALALKPIDWSSLDGEVRWEFFSPVRLGDTFKAISQITGVTRKDTKSVGPAIFADSAIDYYANDGRHLARGTAGVVFYQVENSQATEAQPYNPDPNPLMADVALRALKRRGDEPRYWEDVAVGDEISFTRPTLLAQEIIAWCVGAQVTGYGRKIEMRLESDELRPWDANDLLGVARHLDGELARREGLPGAFDVGTQRTAWLGQLITDWMGDHGDLLELSCRYRKLIFTGDTPTIKATVTRTYEEAGRHLVGFDIVVTTQRGEIASDGSAVVALPRKR